jgi:hypothetical protein
MNKFLFTILVLLLFPAVIFAAGLSFKSNSSELTQNQEFLVNILLDTNGEYLNAIEGKLVFPANILDIKEIRDGNSSINFWIEKPNNSESGVISFSGITPGGIFGKKSLLFGVVFNTKKDGPGSIDFSEIKILKNDSKSTSAEIKTSNFQFLISLPNEQSSGQTSVAKIIDNDPPEDFKPAIGRDSEIADGKYFLVFTTQDKGSGVDHYEVREGFWGKYIVASSPYLLENQSLNKKIYVKVVDKAKNERVVIFKPDQWKWYQQYELLSIIMMLMIMSYFVFKKVRSKK